MKKIMDKMKDGIQFLTENYGRIDIPLGNVQRLKHGKVNLPLGGGPDMLRAIYTRNDENIAKGVAGDCYIQFVEWDPEGNIYLKVFTNLELGLLLLIQNIMMIKQNCFRKRL